MSLLMNTKYRFCRSSVDFTGSTCACSIGDPYAGPRSVFLYRRGKDSISSLSFSVCLKAALDALTLFAVVWRFAMRSRLA